MALSLATSATKISEAHLLKQLYSLEQVPAAPTFTTEEMSGMKQFADSVTRHSDGR